MPQCSQWLSHTQNSHLVSGLLAQTPLVSPPTFSCPFLFYLGQIQEAPGTVLPAVFGTTSAFSCGERRGMRRWSVQKQVKEISHHSTSTVAKETWRKPQAPFHSCYSQRYVGGSLSSYHFCQLLPNEPKTRRRQPWFPNLSEEFTMSSWPTSLGRIVKASTAGSKASDSGPGEGLGRSQSKLLNVQRN